MNKSDFLKKINLPFKNSKTVRRILHNSFSLKPRERRRAERLYHECHETWESYLKNNNIETQFRIDTIQDSIIESQFT